MVKEGKEGLSFNACKSIQKLYRSEKLQSLGHLEQSQVPIQ